MAEDSQSIAPEEPGEDLGQQLVQRAAAPGVIRRDLAARIQRSCCVAETGLATEIQRRFAPEASSPWDQGPALPYAGFGGFGGAPGLPSVQAKVASPMLVARAVGAPAAGGAAAEALSPLGSSLAQRHLGTAQSGIELVQRRSLPGSPATPTSISTSVSAPISTSISTPVQRSGPAGPVNTSVSSPRIVEGPAIVRRSAGSPPAPEMPLLRMSEPDSGGEKPAVQSSVQPVVQASPARTEIGPAIVHRSAARAPVQRMSAAPASSAPAQISRQASTQAPVQRAVSPLSPEPGARVALPLAQPARLQPATPAASVAGASVQRAAAPGAPSPAPHLPLVQAVSGRGDVGGGIVQRAAGAALPTPALTTTAAGLALPLARQAQAAGAGRGATGGAAGGGGVQRQAEGGSSQSAPAAGTLGGTDSEASAPAAATGGTAATGALDLDDVVEQVMRRLKRSLAVESERHGGRRWP